MTFLGARWPPQRQRGRDELLFLLVTLGGLVVGAVARLADQRAVGDAVWGGTTLVALVPASVWVLAGLRKRKPGVDLIAGLALVGALAVGEYLAGAVIAVMLASGRALEAWASAQAHRELRGLLARAPRNAHRHEDDRLTTVPLELVRPGDLLLVKPGEVVPVDGMVEGETAIVDESALTGEPLPVERAPGEAVRSGTLNGGPPFNLRATTDAAASTYAGIVRLVEQADASNAPFVRLADRYAFVFVPFTVALAGLAWVLSGDTTRAVAVLVVATPCPLILAAPVAMVSGLSRAARRGVVVKGGAALEQLAAGQVLLFDKTGTLTRGQPALTDVIAPSDLTADELLRLAASLDQVSPHVLASAVVRAAMSRNLELTLPDAVTEVLGQGIRGRVGHSEVAVGNAAWVAPGIRPSWMRAARRRSDLDGSLTVYVAVDGRPAGALLLEDAIRTDARRTLRRLRRDGIRRIVLVTGDRADAAETVGAALGVDAVLAERTPAEKLEAVRVERGHGRTVMVGDGINDAPALALADVGVAIGARGASVASETADVVLTVDRLDRLGEAMVIARRARAIARQSALAGMGLSLTAMAFAAFGWLAPALGALLQEGIDVAVILNALRALTGGDTRTRLDPESEELSRRFSAEHRSLWPQLERIRSVADSLGEVSPATALADLRSLQEFLVTELIPHEEAEDTQLYPALAKALGGADPTGTMSRAHVEISHLVRRLGRLLDGLGPDGPDADDVRELRSVLYGLHAVLRLHFAQEDEGYFSLMDDGAAPERPAPAIAAHTTARREERDM